MLGSSSNRLYLLVSLVVLLMVFFIAGCVPDSAQEAKESITFAEGDWDSIRVHNAIARMILEEGYGYQTDARSNSEQLSLLGLSNGDVDVYMEIWTGNVFDEYNQLVADGDIVQVSVNYDDNRQGLYVPTFVIEGDEERGIEPLAPNLRSIHDLPDYWALFADPDDPAKGRIYGSVPGWFAEDVMQTKMESYGLSDTYNYFQPSSGTALATALISAIERGEPWVGYYWEPTWVAGKYDLTLLEDKPYNEQAWSDGFRTEFPSQRITIAVQKDLPQEAPDAVEFFSHYSTSSELTSEALAYMEENDATEKEAAIWFLNEFEEIWTGWVPAEVADSVKDAIN
ncbi:ABC transporter substrate-binding protein [Dethiobacter alkaliphilus]|uniref:Substrate-binding region of ABC-type glycine betaine transport system n=1 Tax=Dethiobacter alkaliphilus AHT 1 TaxID=555088 RepID=C0GJ75_DETAL|nr:ABC transporter substrate-binding protein [Dethiobacter alkaliphilus]EEG76560.1 Substrate-binding region of ABC-type glycine betaine transport system [Dethiobacter alkaliphilus AHT 1]